MNRPDIVIENKDLLTYIKYLESIKNGHSRLQLEISLFEDGLADDMEIIRTGQAKEDESNLKYIRVDKRGEKILSIIKLVKDTSSKKGKESTQVESETEKPKIKKNIQDFALNDKE